MQTLVWLYDGQRHLEKQCSLYFFPSAWPQSCYLHHPSTALYPGANLGWALWQQSNGQADLLLPCLETGVQIFWPLQMFAFHCFWKIATAILGSFFQKLGSSLLGSCCMPQAKVRMNHFGKYSSCSGLLALGEWECVHSLALKHKVLNFSAFLGVNGMICTG